MRVQNLKVYDDALDGAITVYTDPALNSQLGAPDTYWIVAIATQASGTAVLTILAEASANNQDWLPGTTLLTLSLTPGSRNVVGSAQITNTLGFVRFNIQLSGTTPKTRLELWFTARDPKTA